MRILTLSLVLVFVCQAQTNLNRPRTWFGTFAQRASVPCPGAELYLPTDTSSLIDKSVCSGGTWIDFHDGLALQPALNTGWTLSDPAKITQSTVAGRSHFRFSPGGPGTDIQVASQPFTTGTMTMCVSVLYSADPSHGGCAFALTGTGASAGQIVTIGHGGPTRYLTSYHLDAASIPNGIFGQIPTVPYESGNSEFQCVRVNRDGENLTVEYSLDGVTFEPFLDIQTPYEIAGFGPACNGGAGAFQAVTVLDVK